MATRLTASLGAGSLCLVAFVACHAPEGAAAPAEAMAPSGSAAPTGSSASASGQVVRFHLTPSEKGRQRQFSPGLALTRVLPNDAGSVAVPTATPSGDAGSGADTSAAVPGPGHYVAHFLVARCAPDSPDGQCRMENPKPDDVEFDVPASGDLDINVR